MNDLLTELRERSLLYQATDEDALRVHLAELLNATVHRIHVRKVDLVQDTTQVEVRYRLAGGHDGRGPGASTATPIRSTVSR